MRPRHLRYVGVGLAVASLLGLSSCASVGPNTIPRDRFDYGKAIAHSWNEQLLTNIVRLRYVEAPVFVDIASVINQYSLEGELALFGGFQTSISGDNSASISGKGRWMDRPTITYVPLTGKQFSISLLTPILPEALFGLVQAGWPPELLLGMTVRTMNGVQNAWASPGNRRQAQPEFAAVLAAWGRLRQAHVLGLRREGSDEGPLIIVYRVGDDLSPEASRDLDLLTSTLGLDPTTDEYTLSYGLIPSGSDEIRVLTTSMLELMSELAWRVDVPPEHITDGRTGPTFEQPPGAEPLIRVHHAPERPDDAFVAIQNRGYWFYVDDRDIHSKRTFSIMQILLSLSESGEPGRGPVVTIGS